MKLRHKTRNRVWSFLLVFAMVFLAAFGNFGTVTAHADSSDGTFVEVTVPNGDFESGSTAWTFEGSTEDSGGTLTDYWRIHTPGSSKAYEACNHDDATTVNYTVSQTVAGLMPGTYKASVEAMGGNDGGSYTAALTAGGKTAAVTPNGWNKWNTYTTDTFTVGEDGKCEIVISMAFTDNYIDLDNVKLYRLVPQGPKTVDKVQPINQRVSVGGTFTAPNKAVVLYTNGESEQFDVTWNAQEVSAVSTAQAGKSYTVNGKVTVENAEYEVVLTVEIIEVSELVQNIGEDALGSIDFDENWKFYLAIRTPEAVAGGFAAAGVKDAGAYTTAQIIASDFDDLSWRTLDVPHDFSIEGEKVETSTDAQAYLQGGLGYYRKKFTVPASMAEKRRISIDFEGVYQNSVIYLNGEEVGAYPSGYTGFALDITDKIQYGAENVLVVKVQNMSPSGRWYTGSGIIRPVHLVIDNLACFNRNGIVLSTPTLEDDYTKSGNAYLEVTGTGYSKASNSNVRMEVSVYDASGTKVAEKATANTAINPNTKFELSLTGNAAIQIPNVQLWYPWNIGEPYLYTVKVDLYGEVNGSADGYQLIDSEEMEYGFRWAKVKETTDDPTSGGLYINGTYTKVQGVDLHHDAGAIGAASYTDAYEREFQKLIDMGVNAYRTSHCPPSKQAIEVCRRKGILVVEEAYDGWGTAKATYDFGNFFFGEVPTDWAGLMPNGYTSLPSPGIDYTGAKLTWSDWVIQEMVKRDMNEPSIIAWSIGNEVRGVGTKPGWYDLTKYDPLNVKPGGMDFYTEAVRLKADIEAIDDSRYVVMGGDNERTVPGVNETWGLVNQVLDGYGLNYNTAASVDGLISRFSIGGTGSNALLENGTKTFFFESESSSQTSSRGVYLDPQFSNTGINQTPGKRGGSNYDNDFANWTMSNEYGLKKDRDRKSFIGQFIWSGFDYLGEPTPYSVYPVGVSSFGTIDTAGFPKDSFYLYQSQWTSGPMVHVLPTNWDQWHEGETVTVWVNTNQPSAELFLNGESLGVKSFDEKETAYGRKYYETSEKTTDDKTWGDSTNPGGYTSSGAILDNDELNSGKLHLTWEVPYEPGTLSVTAYDKDGNEVAQDSVTTSSTPYTILAEPDKTVLAADGSSLSYVECTIVDENGNMVPDAQNLVEFDVTGAVSIFGVDNGKQESAELYKYGNTESSSHSERTAYNGKVLVILKSGKAAGDAVLTVSSKDLKPVQVPICVTADGTGKAPSPITVTGTEQSIDPVEISVPAGIQPILPSAVRVNYNSGAGAYSLMKKVTWGALANGKAEGTVAGCTGKATATVTEDPDVETDIELATGKAQATASFTGSVSSYPEKMVDGDASTTWTNAYSRGASVLLPANSASRKNEYVEFSWSEAQLFNRITLNFTENRGMAVPSVLEAEYFDGSGWTKAPAQTVVCPEETTDAIVQFQPVYTDKVRVYMENGTPFTDNGNMEITEVSVMLSSEKLGAWAILSDAEAIPGETAVSRLQLTDLPDDKTVQEIRFSLDYDEDVFENPNVTLTAGAGGTLATEQQDGRQVYIWTAGAGSAALVNFAEIALTVKADAALGRYKLGLEGLKVKDTDGGEIEISVSTASVTVKEKQLEARRQALKEAIDKAKELNGIHYTEDTYQALLEAIKAAEDVLANENAAQAEVEAQITNLQKSVTNLEIPDLDELLSRLDQLLKEQQAAEEARQKAESEKQAAEAARQKAEAEKQAAEAARQQAEIEKQAVLAEMEQLKNAGAAEQTIKVGNIEEAGGVIYRVTDVAKKEAAAYGVVKAGTKKITVADTVTINGTVCKVTSIANGAFQSLTKVSQVSIGKNVTSIGTKAFFGDKNLKKIQIAGTGLKKVGKNALKNISAKATIKVPKSKKAAYVKLLKGKGQKKSVKIK